MGKYHETRRQIGRVEGQRASRKQNRSDVAVSLRSEIASRANNKAVIIITSSLKFNKII